MIRMKVIKLIACVFCLIFLMSSLFTASAFDPYEAYTYDEWEKGIPAAVGYSATGTYSGNLANQVFIDTPQDMYIDDNGMIYILNSGLKSVIILNNDLSLVREIKTFVNADGSEQSLMLPKGICVDNELIYIADYDAQCVVVSDLYGNVKNIISKPENPVFPQEKEFQPYAVSVDGQGNLYILANNIYQGALVYTPELKFKDFFGGNKIKPTVSLLADRFWQSILSSEADENFSNYVPAVPTNMDITKEGFLYTCSYTNTYDNSNVRCVTPAGEELFLIYGDMEVGVRKFSTLDTQFADIAISDSEYIYALDTTKYRIFVFDTEQSLIFTFGANGSQKGAFSNPVAIETYKDNVYVLDASKGSVTVFEPTEYGKAVLESLEYYEDGKYDESVEGWKQVLRLNANEQLAYNGIGKALLYNGEYEEARGYFKRAANREDESRAFEMYRNNLMRENSALILILIVALVVVIIAIKYVVKTIKKRRCRA